MSGKQNDIEKLNAVFRDVDEAEAKRLTEIWNQAEGVPATEVETIELAAAAARLRGGMRTRSMSVVRYNRMPKIARRFLATAAVILVAAFGLRAWLAPISAVAPVGQTKTMTLSDGSTVHLNSGSTLTYDRRFGDTRHVGIEGEAFFDVVADGRPFHVSTFNASIEVLGTRFNVRSRKREREPTTAVALESGRIRLTTTASPDVGVLLEPGDVRIVSSSDQAVAVHRISVPDAVAWTGGDLVFKEQSLEMIIGEVQRRYKTSVRVESPEMLARELTIAVRQPKNAETVVRDIAAGLGVRYRIRSDGFELFAEAR